LCTPSIARWRISSLTIIAGETLLVRVKHGHLN
jgi:hypothetical protein